MPKLTLRDLFAIVTLAAVLMAWWVDRSRLVEELERLKDAKKWSHQWSIPAGEKNPRSGSTFTLDVF
jgi:hypothetical protein